jgi:hypothetical protein
VYKALTHERYCFVLHQIGERPMKQPVAKQIIHLDEVGFLWEINREETTLLLGDLVLIDPKVRSIRVNRPSESGFITPLYVRGTHDKEFIITEPSIPRQAGKIASLVSEATGCQMTEVQKNTSGSILYQLSLE